MSPKTERTDLEQAVLGVVWRDGPCTPYEVRKQFLDSPTPSWSGSAGTIYPLMKRLEAVGLLSSKDAGRDKRSTKLYRVTAAGRRALASWLQPPLAADAVSPGADPVRTRLLFVELLSKTERRKFFAEVTQQLDDSVRALRDPEREMTAKGERLLALNARGARRVAQARQRWFREAREELN